MEVGQLGTMRAKVPLQAQVGNLKRRVKGTLQVHYEYEGSGQLLGCAGSRP